MKLIRLAPAVVVVLASCVLLRDWASGQTMWLDEEMIALNLRDRHLVDLPGLLWLGQTAPLGWMVAQRLILVLFGTGELALRFVPVLLGIGTLFVAVWIGRRWMTPAGAIVLASLCACAYWLTYFFLELKQYSADTFWALLLPALAAAAVEPEPARFPRIAAWWAIASIAQLFAVGGLLVTPACALAIVAAVLGRDGWRAAVRAALPGLGWLAVFGLHYHLSLQYAAKSEYLYSYWSPNMPPAAAGVAGTLSWLASQLQPLAGKPGGAERWEPFWLAAAIGFFLSSRRAGLGLFFGGVVLSGFALAALRLVPLADRVSLWMMPALYVGIALCVDAALRIARRGYAARRWSAFAAALLVGVVGVSASVDVMQGARGFLRGRPASNQQLDDRSAVLWLMSQRRPGDAVMTTHHSLPAIWWYGSIPIGTPGIRGGEHPDGGPILELKYANEPCQSAGFKDAFGASPRALVYLGWIDDRLGEFDHLVRLQLAEVGKITEERGFARSQVLIVDLRSDGTGPQDSVRAAATPGRPAGCLEAVPARRALIAR